MQAQVPITLGPQTSTFTSWVRGYYFVAPVNFTICRLYVEPTFSTQWQHVEVVRLNVTPPTYPTTTNNFTSLFYQNNYVPNTPIVCNIPITAGQIIGVYGARSNTTNMQVSYGDAPWVTPIYGSNATLYYSGMQFPLNNQQMHDIWYANFSRLSRVTMYYDCVVLPEGLLSLDAYANGEDAQLSWEFSTEAKWSFWELQRSREGEDFTPVATQHLNPSETKRFEYLDVTPGLGNIYYRLRLIDADGVETMSNVVSVSMDRGPRMSIYPHPAPTTGFFVRLPQFVEGKVRVSLSDLQGHQVWGESYDSETPFDRLALSPMGILPGLYLLQVASSAGIQSTKVVVVDRS